MKARFVCLIAVTVLAACAGGTTMRVAGDDSSESEPVALAPEPDVAPDSVSVAPDSVTPTPPSSGGVEPAVSPGDTATRQGYAPYGAAPLLQIRRIGQWTHTGINERRRMVIRDVNGWAAFWSELGTGAGDRPPVDFTRDLVIAVAAGQQSSGGHEIAVEKVTQNNGELMIEVLETSPGPNCMTTAALTQPVDVVVIPAVGSRGWSFVERKEVRSC